MKVCSLFSGIGGVESGVLNAIENSEVVFACEKHKKTAQAYELRFGIKPEGDITKIDEQQIPNHDLLVGGFPCQAFSQQGLKKGFNDTRGTLFFDVARIAKEKQPKVIMLENVKGLISHDKGKTIEVILKTLNEIGYYVDFDVLNSKHFGVAQNRERIVIIGVRKDLTEKSEPSESKVFCVKREKKNLAEVVDFVNFYFPNRNEVTTSINDIMCNDLSDRVFMKNRFTYNDELIQTLKNKLNNPKPANKDLHQLTMVDESVLKTHESKRRLYDTRGLAPTVLCHEPPKIAVLDDTARGVTVRLLTPLECLKLQGFEQSFYDTLRLNNYSDTQIYKMAGNAVTVNVFEAVSKQIKQLFETF